MWEKILTLEGKNACGYPGTDKYITEFGGILKNEDVVTDGNMITSRGPGRAQKFALALVETLYNKETATKIVKSVLFL